jgi:hypothetical protein
MCYKRSEAEREVTRLQETERREQHRRPEPWRNTKPRGNQEPDRHDLERSVERLEALVGR